MQLKEEVLELVEYSTLHWLRIVSKWLDLLLTVLNIHLLLSETNFVRHFISDRLTVHEDVE